MNKILVTGGSGMVGRHLRRVLLNGTYLSSKSLNLLDREETIRFFERFRPDRVIHLAAKVGGILDNINNPYSFFGENIRINQNVLDACVTNGVKRMTAILSTCSYPDVSTVYPMTEDMMHLGPPAESNLPYGYSKRCMAVAIEAINKQFNKQYNYLIPSNMYSEHDHFVGNKSHFVPSFLQKIHDFKTGKSERVEIFGSGKPLRQFMYANDLARAIKVMVDSDCTENFNVCCDENLSILEIAETCLRVCGVEKEHLDQVDGPDGQYRKDVTSQKFLNRFPDFRFTRLEDGIKETYEKKFTVET